MLEQERQLEADQAARLRLVEDKMRNLERARYRENVDSVKHVSTDWIPNVCSVMGSERKKQIETASEDELDKILPSTKEKKIN